MAEQLAEKLNAKLNYQPKGEEDGKEDEPVETFKKYEEELEINDFPQQARWRVTSKVTTVYDIRSWKLRTLLSSFLIDTLSFHCL